MADYWWRDYNYSSRSERMAVVDGAAVDADLSAVVVAADDDADDGVVNAAVGVDADAVKHERGDSLRERPKR